jgi:hypothetical protein
VAVAVPSLHASAVHDAGLNVLVLTLSHCRGLTASRADMPVLKSFAEIRAAQRLARGSGSAHRKLFAGLLPGDSADPPIPDAWLPSELGELGYQTVGVGHDSCFDSPELLRGFTRFGQLDHEAPAQLAALLDEIEPDRPFFAFANLTDTRNTPNLDFFGQAVAAARVDAALPALLTALPENTFVVACSDFGLCFGEGNCWGARPFHPVHRDVFVARFRLDGEPLP